MGEFELIRRFFAAAPCAQAAEGVALGIGFEDPFHFSHAFKNVFGVSPDAFRRSSIVLR